MHTDYATVVDPILFQMISQKHAVKLEALGLKHSRGSVTAFCKRQYKIKGNRDKVLSRLQELIDQRAEELRGAK